MYQRWRVFSAKDRAVGSSAAQSLVAAAIQMIIILHIQTYGLRSYLGVEHLCVKGSISDCERSKLSHVLVNIAQASTQSLH